jgi:hypothetical protein
VLDLTGDFRTFGDQRRDDVRQCLLRDPMVPSPTFKTGSGLPAFQEGRRIVSVLLECIS